jgi:tRNA(adenine34) deaminase
MQELAQWMRLAIQEARTSLSEGNCGFGAVVLKDGHLVAQAHDTEKTAGDPTAHAEITAVRLGARALGRELHGCTLVATHEPCPMCASAVLWAGIEELAYGFSITQAINQGRRRIPLSCREIFARAGKSVVLHEDILHAECAVLYNKAVRSEVDRLRGADDSALRSLAKELSARRIAWFHRHYPAGRGLPADPLGAAYQVFLAKLGIAPADVPVVQCEPRQLVIHSRNFCPTLEACQILGLDTRRVCRLLTQEPTTDLLRQIDPRLRFTRCYETLRPHSQCCEEMIVLDE